MLEHEKATAKRGDQIVSLVSWYRSHLCRGGPARRSKDRASGKARLPQLNLVTANNRGDFSNRRLRLTSTEII